MNWLGLLKATLPLVSVVIFGVWRTSSATQAQQPDTFRVTIPGQVLAMPTGSGTFGQSLGKLTGYANGTACAAIDLPTATNDVAFDFGVPGQAAVCSMEGALITFTSGTGAQLQQTFTLRRGGHANLSNFAPPPPGTRPSTGATTSSGQGTVTPPSTGDAGLK